MPVTRYQHYLFVLIAAYSVAIAGDETDPVADCATISAPAERIACLESAIARLTSGQAEQAAEVETPPRAVSQEQAGASAVPPKASHRDDAQIAAELGARHLESATAQKKPATRIRARVVAFDFIAHDKLRVRLDNGQVWRQTDADRPNHARSLRDLETFDVDLWETSLGGFRMHIHATDRTVRVQRLE